jgi:2'-5' RNA ligase
MIRAFVAIELEESLRQALAQVQATLRSRLEKAIPSGARIQWVKPASIHLTLKFLGDIPEERVPEIQAALAQAVDQHARCTLEVGGLGVFPHARAPRVLWIGLADHDGAVQQLVSDVETALVVIGFRQELKPFHPHLTLARIKEQSHSAGRALTAGGLLEQSTTTGRLPVTAVALMKSDLQPSGSVYTRLAHILLKEA